MTKEDRWKRKRERKERFERIQAKQAEILRKKKDESKYIYAELTNPKSDAIPIFSIILTLGVVSIMLLVVGFIYGEIRNAMAIPSTNNSTFSVDNVIPIESLIDILPLLIFSGFILFFVLKFLGRGFNGI